MCLVPRQPRSRRDSRARRHVNRVVAHQCGILLGPEKERSIATRPLGPLLSPRHLIDASPLESPSTHSVFSGGGPRVQPPQKGAAGVCLSSSWWQRCRPLSPAAQGQVGLLPNQAVQKPAPQDRWNTSLKPRWSRLRRRPCRKQPKAGERGWEGPGGAGRGRRQEGAGPGQGGLAGGHILLERGRPATRELGTTKALSWIESWSPKGGSPS